MPKYDLNALLKQASQRHHRDEMESKRFWSPTRCWRLIVVVTTLYPWLRFAIIRLRGLPTKNFMYPDAIDAVAGCLLASAIGIRTQNQSRLFLMARTSILWKSVVMYAVSKMYSCVYFQQYPTQGFFSFSSATLLLVYNGVTCVVAAIHSPYTDYILTEDTFVFNRESDSKPLTATFSELCKLRELMEIMTFQVSSCGGDGEDFAVSLAPNDATDEKKIPGAETNHTDKHSFEKSKKL